LAATLPLRGSRQVRRGVPRLAFASIMFGDPAVYFLFPGKRVVDLLCRLSQSSCIPSYAAKAHSTKPNAAFRSAKPLHPINRAGASRTLLSGAVEGTREMQAFSDWPILDRQNQSDNHLLPELRGIRPFKVARVAILSLGPGLNRNASRNLVFYHCWASVTASYGTGVNQCVTPNEAANGRHRLSGRAERPSNLERCGCPGAVFFSAGRSRTGDAACCAAGRRP